jgi:hypothetical protein
VAGTTTKRLGTLLSLVMFSCTLASCSGPRIIEATRSPDYDYSTVVAGIVKLHTDADENWPEHFNAGDPPRLGTEFDPNAYFTVLTHLRMADDYVLDFVYWGGIRDGMPFLYARHESAERFKTYKDYEEALGGRWAVYDAEAALFDKIRADGSPESFFELAVLHELGGDFYLAAHCNYRWSRIVLTHYDIVEIAENGLGRRLTAKQKWQAFMIDLQPRIQFVGRGEVTVSIVTYSPWHGFTRETFHMRRRFPHKLLAVHHETLVQFDCGLRF